MADDRWTFCGLLADCFAHSQLRFTSLRWRGQQPSTGRLGSTGDRGDLGVGTAASLFPCPLRDMPLLLDRSGTTPIRGWVLFVLGVDGEDHDQVRVQTGTRKMSDMIEVLKQTIETAQRSLDAPHKIKAMNKANEQKGAA